MSQGFPPIVDMQLTGWDLEWAELLPTGGGEDRLGDLWDSCFDELRDRFAARALTDDPMVGRIRALFRAAGCDPTRYRPSSEALARRALKGQPPPRIHPLVDLNNLLSIRLLAPCCVLDVARLRPPMTLRSGRAGEIMQSMRGSFDLAGKPVLVDVEGPFGTPITDSERVMVTRSTSRAWVVVYLPHESESSELVRETMADLLDRAPVAELR